MCIYYRYYYTRCKCNAYRLANKRSFCAVPCAKAVTDPSLPEGHPHRYTIEAGRAERCEDWTTQYIPIHTYCTEGVTGNCPDCAEHPSDYISTLEPDLEKHISDYSEDTEWYLEQMSVDSDTITWETPDYTGPAKPGQTDEWISPGPGTGHLNTYVPPPAKLPKIKFKLNHSGTAAWVTGNTPKPEASPELPLFVIPKMEDESPPPFLADTPQAPASPPALPAAGPAPLPAVQPQPPAAAAAPRRRRGRKEILPTDRVLRPRGRDGKVVKSRKGWEMRSHSIKW